jgi:hypothetical protein
VGDREDNMVNNGRGEANVDKRRVNNRKFQAYGTSRMMWRSLTKLKTRQGIDPTIRHPYSRQPNHTPHLRKYKHIKYHTHLSTRRNRMHTS